MAARLAAIWWSGGVHLDRGSGRRSGTSYSTSCARACVVCEKIKFRFSLGAVLDASSSSVSSVSRPQTDRRINCYLLSILYTLRG